MTAPSLSVVVPLYNEERRVQRLVDELKAYGQTDVAAAGLTLHEVVAVDDGSTDGTAAALRAAAEDLPWLRLVSDGSPNAGKGAAIARGVAVAGGEWVLLLDADLATPLDQLSALTPLMEAGADVVVASRDLAGSVVVGAPRHRYILGRGFNRIVRALTGLHLRDTQCGFKLLRTADARRLTHRQVVRRWAFDVELLMRARQAGLELGEAPVYYLHGKASKLSPLSAAPKMLWDVLRVVVVLRLRPRDHPHGHAHGKADPAA